MRKFLTATAVALAAIVVIAVATGPQVPRSTSALDPALAGRTIAGAFHVHTIRSDGAADKAGVARAARRAGLQFVVLTDHGDGMRPADPPEYLDSVLCLDGVEISTNGGHYIAVGASPSPYPLGGDSAAVVEDVARLGGFGIAAHPGSARRELAWADWSLPVDGVEWLNADSEWRDESRWRLARAVAAYPTRPAGALATLLDRPESDLARWDAVASRRRVLAIAGHDAHGGVGRRLEQPTARWNVRVPSYEAAFRTFSTRVELDRPLTGNPAADGAALVATLKAGRFYTAIDAVAAGSTFEFIGRTADGTAGQGSVLRGAGAASFTARAAVPEEASIVALHNGAVVARGPGGSLHFDGREMGAYRVEVHVAGAPGVPPVPWLVSNPIFRLAQMAEPPPRPRDPVWPLRTAAWRIERNDASQGSARIVNPADEEVEFQYRLQEGARVSQFVALVADLPRDVPAFDGVAFVARSNGPFDSRDPPLAQSRPCRVSVQLRFAKDGNARWVRSVYADGTARPLTVALNDLRHADGPSQRPDARRATSLLFVVDLTNALPGAAGTITLKDVMLVK